ncbi:MAG: DNA polymerase III subunit gamma/tau [Piscinibacter sp.]|uniref:DNA polymerase III subunit gamma/tau n=1 Tax=Piscinibacter sp. TaxID=1903157 RepID=UPI001B413DEB|nr:DNA polymerase III subunit gamma/tau [Piscinibacter sp.]MBP5989313.1 DNA polymerase III subunit gamma/tau [Piscinibacter sp.]MBP6026897.1 DNA polymerase III subunit gamma/tau [Piscinibacter sp.]
MSYLVLARKYRPRSFEAMVGQEHVVQALANALTQQRLHHAYLFTGTRGVGKTTVSRILAKSLNCTGPDGQGGITAQPCGVCDACRDIDAGRFVDYVELDAASNRGVEEISQLLDQAVYKPVLGRFKVYMIDEVHMLSNTAFNAMLKTLEEPPEYLKFVLATTDPQKVPPTVLSRCLQFNLRPMAPQTVQEHLAAVLAQEQIAAEPGALRLLARAARGSMRDALSLTDQAIAFGAGALAEAGVRQMLGAVDRGHAVRLVEALAGGDGAALIQSVDGLRALGLSAAGTLEEMAALLQQMAVQQAVPGALDAGDPDTAVVERLAAALAPDETQLLYSIVVHGRGELALAPDEYSGLVMVLLRMLAFKPAGSGSAERVAPRPAAAPAQAVSAAAARPAAVAAAPALRVPTPPPVARSPEPPPWVDAPDENEFAEPAGLPPPEIPEPRPRAVVATVATVVAVATTPLGDRWTALVKRLVEAGAISALVRELAMQSECIGFDEARIVLRVDRETLRSAANVDKLGAAITQLLGRAVALQVEAGTPEDSPARRDAAERARRQAEAEQIIADDPLVKALMAQYKTARIVPGSIKPH